MIDTTYAAGKRSDRRNFHTGEYYLLQARSAVLLYQTKSPR